MGHGMQMSTCMLGVNADIQRTRKGESESNDSGDKGEIRVGRGAELNLICSRSVSKAPSVAQVKMDFDLDVPPSSPLEQWAPRSNVLGMRAIPS